MFEQSKSGELDYKFRGSDGFYGWQLEMLEQRPQGWAFQWENHRSKLQMFQLVMVHYQRVVNQYSINMLLKNIPTISQYKSLAYQHLYMFLCFCFHG